VTDKQLSIVNAMSVDVEDYYQVSAFENIISRRDWHSHESRVERNTHIILDMFSEKDVKATFFTLGCVAEKSKDLVRRIVSEGHELASHGYNHTRVIHQNEAQFKEDVSKTKKLLEDIGGVRVRGYRAASYSIGEKNLWALNVLHQCDYEYSSSIYPIKHDLYGMPNAPRFSFYPMGETGILEIPVTTLEILGRRFPCGGGGFFRFYPYRLSKWAIDRVNDIDQQASIFYFHPWEIDPGQPRQQGISFKTRFRHYLNLKKMRQRLEHLVGDFRWGRMDEIFLSQVDASTYSSSQSPAM